GAARRRGLSRWRCRLHRGRWRGAERVTARGAKALTRRNAAAAPRASDAGDGLYLRRCGELRATACAEALSRFQARATFRAVSHSDSSSEPHSKLLLFACRHDAHHQQAALAEDCVDAIAIVVTHGVRQFLRQTRLADRLVADELRKIVYG